MKRVLVLVTTVAVAALMLAAGCATKPSRDDLQKNLEKAQASGDAGQAVTVYRDIVKYYPEGDEAAKAQFMIGYLYANELDDTAKARVALNAFIDNYAAVSDSQLVLSAKMELENLGSGPEAYEKILFDKEDK